MSFFSFLDNRFRNLSLDNQIEFSLNKEGHQKASHYWVIAIRRFFTVVHFCLLPFKYASQMLHITSPDEDHATRIEELKAYTEKVLTAAKQAQVNGQPLPANPAELIAPAVTKPSENN